YDIAVHEADAVSRQQTAHRRCYRFDLVGLRVHGLVRHAGPKTIEKMRQEDDQPDQQVEDHDRVRHFVADTFDQVQHFFDKIFLFRLAGDEVTVVIEGVRV